jgi:cytochrome P450
LHQGTSIIVSQWLFHHSARFWHAPNDFRLDRNYLKTNAYIPFGAGPRVCVGASFSILEMQILALELASDFELFPWAP